MKLKRDLWVLEGVLYHDKSYPELARIAKFYEIYDIAPSTYDLAPLMKIKSPELTVPPALMKLKSRD